MQTDLEDRPIAARSNTHLPASASLFLDRIAPVLFAAVLLLVPVNSLRANSMRAVTLEQQLESALAICRGRVIDQTTYRDPSNLRIHTRTHISVDEALKGIFPPRITVTHRGGVLDGEGLVDHSAPRLQIGGEHVFLLELRKDGTFFCYGGSGGTPSLSRAQPETRKSRIPRFTESSLSLLQRIRKQFPNPETSGPDLRPIAEVLDMKDMETRSLAGLSSDSSGVSRRFIAGDRGETIEYLVDADVLPSGITLDLALSAVTAAFKAWSSVTTLTFSFSGIESFGQSAGNVSSQDGKIRIQLHDLYQDIRDPAQLGVGGNDFLISSVFPTGGMGGNVGGTEFFPVTQGFVTLKHTQKSLSNPKTFEEVLCHEIGHALSMDHSSEDASETDPLLRDALMFRNAHEDGRGARLSPYDPPVVQKAYPNINTPPFGYDRFLRVITTPGPEPTLPGINQIEFTSYDLQTENLTLKLVLQSGVGAGDFVLTGNTLKFTPSGFFSAPELDPSTQSYGLAYLRISDGTNGSPYCLVKVISLQTDQNPRNAPDGLPDDWVAKHFGNDSAPVNPNADTDGDGISNIDEFFSGTNPTDPSDALKISSVTQKGISWRANVYDLYEVHGTVNFVDWFRVGNPVIATTPSATLSDYASPTGEYRFFRLVRLP